MHVQGILRALRQMATTLAFLIVFDVCGDADAIAECLNLRSGDGVYDILARRWPLGT